MVENDSKDRFFDDEEFLKNNDEVLVDENDVAVLKQLDNAVSIEIDNFYKENSDKPRSRSSLLREPPLLKISSSDGQFTNFFITENLARILKNDFENIDRAYRGLSVKEDKPKKTFQDNLQSFLTWMKDNKIKTICGFLVLALFVYGIVQF